MNGDRERTEATSKCDNEDLRIGSRCKLSELGRKNMPRHARQVCTVIGIGKTRNQVRVMFDGSKNAQTLHRSYVEEIAD